MTLLAESVADTIIEPLTVADLGLERGLLVDLVLKTLFYRGRMTREDLGGELKLSGGVLQEILQFTSTDALTSVLGADDATPSRYTYALTQKGIERADSALNRSGYVGPAPVSIKDYIDHMRVESVRARKSSREAIEQALSPLVLDESTKQRVGRAAASRRSTLVYGASGNGKTTMVRAMGDVLDGTILIPHAIEMFGQIVQLYDPSKHVRADDPVAAEYEGPTSIDQFRRSRFDRRWIRVRRPAVWAGGELTRHSLELVYDTNTKVYEAPLQLKANGGILIIDDFGRQQMPAVQLLNRFIVPLEGGVDHLTLHTGQTVEIPFDVLVLFSTNLAPDRLADDAFLRRIRYKIEIPSPNLDEYRQIFRRECDRHGIPYDESAVTHLIEAWYLKHNREFRGCHPRDLLEAVVDAASYDARAPRLTVSAIDEACTTYFLQPLAPQ